MSVDVGVHRLEQKGSHQPTPAWIITAVEPALERVNISNQTNAKHAHTATAYTTNAALQTNTVTYKPFTAVTTTQRIRTDRNLISQKHTVTGAYRGSFPQTPPPPPPPPPHPGKKGSGLASLSRPKTRAFSPELVFHLPSTRHMTGENTTCHAQTVDLHRQDRRQALRRGTRYPKTYLDPQTYLSPNY